MRVTHVTHLRYDAFRVCGSTAGRRKELPFIHNRIVDVRARFLPHTLSVRFPSFSLSCSLALSLWVYGKHACSCPRFASRALECSQRQMQSTLVFIEAKITKNPQKRKARKRNNKTMGQAHQFSIHCSVLLHHTSNFSVTCRDADSNAFE